MKNIKFVIFDFDGTIADTMPFSFSRSLELLRKEKIDLPEKEIIKKIKSNSYLELMKEFKLSWLRIPFMLQIVKQTQRDLYSQIDKIKIFPGIKKLLKGLKNNNYRIGILSSNMQRNINKFIKIKRLNFFDIIYCESNILGKDQTFRKMMRKYNLKQEEIIYIGDEIRDIVACKKVGIKIIGVSWGLHTFEALQKNGVDYIVKKPSEILNIIN
ncbi:HAD-IA family hydrolase [Candidatus Roizmanbacteria bacterium]|nr:HAD-IA family hydrolase [Candidatus Roizmanbacteria bacterium]